jgi:hypothetical protein
MGLDVTAYSKVEFLEAMDAEAWEEKYWMNEKDMPFRTAIAHHWESCYADRAAPIIEGGVYRINGDEVDVHGGSYTGYNEWRDWLSRTMLGVPARAVWENEEIYKGRPFYELINFSDCEGIIGSVVAAKLAADFETHQAPAEHYGQRDDGWYAKKYREWRKAFTLAADGGFVMFH